MLKIVAGGLDDPQVIRLLGIHLTNSRAQTAPGSAHALDLAGLKSPKSASGPWDGDDLLAIGAMKRLSHSHGEVKSMHTAGAVRRRGVGSAMLEHIIHVARNRGIRKLSLETGSWAYFQPAVALYKRHGFVECPPFGDYKLDPNSIFMTRDL